MTWIAAWWLRRQHPPVTVEVPAVDESDDWTAWDEDRLEDEEPVDEPKVTLTIRLSPELHARLVKAAQERLVSVSWLTNRAITEFLDNLLPPDEWSGVDGWLDQ